MAFGVADVFGLGERDRSFEHVERRSRVATGEPDEVIEGLLAERHASVRPERASQTSSSSSSARRTTVPTSSSVSASRRQTRIRDSSAEFTSKYGFSVVAPIKRDRAVLDMGQQRVLLRLVEPMDLVEEQDGPRTVQGQPFLGLGDRRADIGDAGHDRGHRRELGPDLPREQPGEARLPGAGWSPQQQRREMAPGDAPAQRSALADEVLLSDELVERPRPHPRGERLAFGRWLEERLGLRASGARTC